MKLTHARPGDVLERRSDRDDVIVVQVLPDSDDNVRCADYLVTGGREVYRMRADQDDPAIFHGHFRDVESVFWKQDQYRYQREFRFAINRGSLGECPLVMDIGDIRDITLQFKSTELNGKNFLAGPIEVFG